MANVNYSTPELVAIFPILKRERDKTYTFAMNLEKTLYRRANPLSTRLKKLAITFGSVKAPFIPSTNELNMFLVANTKFSPLVPLELNDRVKIEQRLSRQHEKYAKKIIRQIQNEAKTDTELRISRNIFREFAKIFNEEEIRKTADADFDQVINDFSYKYEEIIKTSIAFLWDFPGGSQDRIATPQVVATSLYEHEDGTVHEPDQSITEIADELALLVFSSKYLEHLIPILENTHKYIALFANQVEIASKFFDSYESDKKKDIVIEFFSVGLGKILGAREFLNVTRRQVERLKSIGEEFKAEAIKMGSEKLSHLADEFSSPKQIDHALSMISKLIDVNTSFIEPLRDLAKQLNDAPVTKSKTKDGFVDIAAYFIHVYHAIEELRFLSDQFSDIQFFTSLSGDVAYEKEGEIEYEVPQDVVLCARNLFKTYELARSTIYALRGVNLDIKEGEFVAITGSSGSGKTTLINLLSGLDQPDRGAVFIRRQNIVHLSDNQLTDLRRKEVGFIFQFYNLIAFLKSNENVALPAQLDGNRKGAMRKADNLLEDVGLEQFIKQYPNLLSGGQMQRVTIARALMNNPSIIFADEPTGDLDSETGEAIIELLEAFHKQGSTIVLVTHDPAISSRAEREIILKDGQIIEDINLKTKE